MLKTYPTTFLLPKRLKLASLAARRDPDSATAAAPASVTGQTNASSTLSSAASLPPQQDHRQPILFHSHQAMSSAESPPKPKSAMAAAYFPLGYKEAAQQWVSLHVLPRRPPRSVHAADMTDPRSGQV